MQIWDICSRIQAISLHMWWGLGCIMSYMCAMYEICPRCH
jgi:hypothetical protein